MAYDPQLLGRIERRLQPDGDCLIWTGAKSPAGYGQVSSGSRKLGTKRALYIHRVVYEAAKGTIPDGLVIDHLCRRRDCGNPAHLEAVTHRVNILRGNGASAGHARQTHCLRGHEFDEANTHVDARGTRWCRACSRVRDQLRAPRRQKAG